MTKKKVYAVLFTLLIPMVLLGCSGGGQVEEMGYQDFKETIGEEDFTGFAYILSNFKAEEDGYLNSIIDVFEEENASLVFYNDQQASDRTHEIFNEDSGKIDLYLPTNDIAYIVDGEVVAEFEIDEQITMNEGRKALSSFINENKE
ncbi:hypothetical protein [Oceanobacillus timonensis]|uniref:hypothetical protein n=1 Tax=Oceanobacillus timonensis TaxID=1926285 RepID=UPI0009BBB76F|nr:hypothetical protein [Oceanobacillus timonensis]